MSTHPPATAPRRLSPSALERYRGCPKAFHYQYIDKTEGDDRPSPVLVVGNAVHAALERFYGLPDEHRRVEILHQALRSVWPAHRSADVFDCVDDETEAGRSALDMLTRYAETHDLSVRPREREEWIRLTLKNGIALFGKVDRIDVQDDLVSVIDYKTGRRALAKRELPDNIAAQVYALAVAERFPGQQLAFRLEYLALGRDLEWRPSSEELGRARERLLALTDEIHEREDFAATPGAACGFCPYASICVDRGRTTIEQIEIRETVPF